MGVGLGLAAYVGVALGVAVRVGVAGDESVGGAGVWLAARVAKGVSVGTADGVAPGVGWGDPPHAAHNSNRLAAARTRVFTGGL